MEDEADEEEDVDDVSAEEVVAASLEDVVVASLEDVEVVVAVSSRFLR